MAGPRSQIGTSGPSGQYELVLLLTVVLVPIVVIWKHCEEFRFNELNISSGQTFENQGLRIVVQVSLDRNLATVLSLFVDTFP